MAQIVFLDHRGNGRSEAGPPEAWSLAQWGDDVRGFCDTLGIARPIVYGASFGGTVALAYATRHPEHPARLILVSTEAAAETHRDRRVALFERFGGPEVGALARRRFVAGDTDAATLEAWVRLAFPLYTRTPRNPDAAARAMRRPEVTRWFLRPGGEGHTFDLVPALSKVADIAAALPSHLVRFERFAGCGHAVVPDAGERAMAVIRNFIVEESHHG